MIVRFSAAPSVRSRQVASYHRENFAPDCHAKDARAASASERADRISACNFFSLATVLPSSPYDRSLEFLRTKQVKMRVTYFALCAAALVGPVAATLSLGESCASSASTPSLTQSSPADRPGGADLFRQRLLETQGVRPSEHEGDLLPQPLRRLE